MISADTGRRLALHPRPGVPSRAIQYGQRRTVPILFLLSNRSTDKESERPNGSDSRTDSTMTAPSAVTMRRRPSTAVPFLTAAQSSSMAYIVMGGLLTVLELYGLVLHRVHTIEVPLVLRIGIPLVLFVGGFWRKSRAQWPALALTALCFAFVLNREVLPEGSIRIGLILLSTLSLVWSASTCITGNRLASDNYGWQLL